MFFNFLQTFEHNYPSFFIFFSDPCMNLGHSPAAVSKTETDIGSVPITYNIGSVSSTYTGSDPDSDSDNCNAQKMAAPSEIGPVPSSGMDDVLDEDFDFIAKVLYNHPAIQAVMANNL